MRTGVQAFTAESDEPMTPDDVTGLLLAHRHLVTDDGPLREWWRETR